MGVARRMTLLWLQLLASLLFLAGARSSLNTLTTITGTAYVSSIEYPEDKHVRSLFVKTTDGLVIRGEFPDPELLEELDIHSGQSINVTGTLNTTANPEGQPASIQVFKVVPLQPRQVVEPTVYAVRDSKVQINGQSSNIALPVSQHEPLVRKIKMLVIPIRAVDANGRSCPGVKPIPYTKRDIENVLWGNGSPSGGFTLGSFYEECSDQRTVIDVRNSRVSDFAILPCSGTTSFGRWSIPGCTDNDGWGWQIQADAYVTRQLGIRLEDYDFITYLGPPTNVVCSWLAVADYGCAANSNNYICRTWAHGTGWNAVAMYMHEIGHNFYLGHSGQVVPDGRLVEYADLSSTMGFCCNLRCYNAPHSYQMGWLATTELDGRRLTPGTTYSFELAPVRSGGRGVRVTPSWNRGAVPFFIQYRDTQGYDKDLGRTYGLKTNIYASPITSPRSGGATQWLGALDDASRVWTDRATGITVRHVRREGAGARVSICRYGGPEDLRSCCYGRDNDCNGLGGPSDPACGRFMPQCSSFRYQFDLGSTSADPGRPSRAAAAGGNATEVPALAPSAARQVTVGDPDLSPVVAPALEDDLLSRRNVNGTEDGQPAGVSPAAAPAVARKLAPALSPSHL